MKIGWLPITQLKRTLDQEPIAFLRTLSIKTGLHRLNSCRTKWKLSLFIFYIAILIIIIEFLQIVRSLWYASRKWRYFESIQYNLESQNCRIAPEKEISSFFVQCQPYSETTSAGAIWIEGSFYCNNANTLQGLRKKSLEERKIFRQKIVM